MSKRKADDIRKAVRDSYGEIARSGEAGCGCTPSSCCGDNLQQIQPLDASTVASAKMGYSNEELASVPEGANLGLGCGNPQAIANLKPGEVVVDLGSGAGFDCFLAAKNVGETGQVIGVDMTADMISRARENAEKGGYSNVGFRLGEIEHLPLADNSADVIISNCVINLSPDKPSVFRDSFRVLKPGGRMAVSDVVATAEMPDDVKADLALYSACVSGAAFIDDLTKMMSEAGFEQIRIKPKDESREFIREWAEGRNLEDYVVSATIEAVKPSA